MNLKQDDLEAVRILFETLKPFEKKEQERIIRWACEKLGNPIEKKELGPSPHVDDQNSQSHQSHTTPITLKDIKSFVQSKNPTSDMQFATTIAYYYTFEAPESQRKNFISSDDLQDACRLLGRERLNNPPQTLRNACFNGMLDKAEEKGTYKINTVGENLVAM